MTLAEFQPHVEQAVTALEWTTARARWRQALMAEREAIEKALPLAGQYGVEREPLESRLGLIAIELNLDVTADQVPQHPIRSVPMDLITAAVIRNLLRLPAAFPVLSIKAVPDEAVLLDAVSAIALRWYSPFGAVTEEAIHVLTD